MFFERNGSEISQHYRENKRPKHHGIISLEHTMLSPFLSFEIGEQVTTALLTNAEPIFVDDTQVAWIILPETTGLSLGSQLNVFLQNMHKILFFSMVCGVVASLALGVALSRWLLKPMHALTDAMSSMANGRLQQSVPIESSNELGELAKGFNRMSQSLADADQKKRQLTADITHDLSTPVQVISGYVEMAQHGALPLDDKRLETVSSELMLIQRLIKDMNLLAKTDNNSLVMQCSKVSIGELLTRVHQRFLPQCQRENILLQLTAEPALPTIELDEERMTQVLGNLMDNAIRHTPGQGSIRLSASASDTECEIVVSDTGERIEPNQLSQIFDRFYRVESSRTGVEGNSGLGLSICRALLEMQGATVRAESDGKTGSHFIIQIPII